MPLAVSLEEDVKTSKMELVDLEALAEPREVSLFTGDFELVDAAEIVSESTDRARRPVSHLLKDPRDAARSGLSIATLTGSLPVARVASREDVSPTPLPGVDRGPLLENRRRRDLPLHQVVFTRRMKRRWSEWTWNRVATWRRFLRDEGRSAIATIRATSMKLSLALALIAGAFLVGVMTSLVTRPTP
jgi:hypothetical protein